MKKYFDWTWVVRVATGCLLMICVVQAILEHNVSASLGWLTAFAYFVAHQFSSANERFWKTNYFAVLAKLYKERGGIL